MSVNVTYIRDIPDGPNNPSVDQPKMQINTNAIDQIIAVDHVSFNTNGGGWHNQVTFAATNVPAIPLTGVSPPVLFTKDVIGAVSTLPELFYYSGLTANTSDQYLSGTTLGSEGSTFLFAGIIVKWKKVSATDTGNPITFAKPFPNQCFGVVATLNEDANAVVSIDNITVAGFKAFAASAFGPFDIFYIAIGN